jgi:drug/metabolite transporter (DMT)-like permease
LSAWLYGLQLTIGLACSVLGGYVAARVAKHDELLNGLLSSFLCIAIGVISIFSGKDSQSVLVQIFLLAAAPAFAFLGGYLRQTQKRMGRTAA